MPFAGMLPLSRCADSNRGPTPYHGVALPTELQRQICYTYYFLPGRRDYNGLNYC